MGFRDTYEFFGIRLDSDGNNLWNDDCTVVNRRITWTTIPQTDVDFFYLHVKAVDKDCMQLFPPRWYSVPKVCCSCNHVSDVFTFVGIGRKRGFGRKIDAGLYIRDRGTVSVIIIVDLFFIDH